METIILALPATDDRKTESDRATSRETDRQLDQQTNVTQATIREESRQTDQKRSSKGILANPNLSLLIVVMIAVNTVLSLLTFVDYSLANATASSERHQIINDVAVLKTRSVDDATFQKNLSDMTAKADKIMELATKVSERQAVNEANISLNYTMLNRIMEGLPSTRPSPLPSQLQHPDEK